MEPTTDELVALRATPTCRGLADWVEMADQVRECLFTALGVQDLGKLRLIARLPLADWTEITATLKIADAGLSPMQGSQVGLFWETARLVCGMAMTTEETIAERAKAEELEMEKLKVMVTLR